MTEDSGEVFNIPHHLSASGRCLLGSLVGASSGLAPGERAVNPHAAGPGTAKSWGKN